MVAARSVWCTMIILLHGPDSVRPYSTRQQPCLRMPRSLLTWANFEGLHRQTSLPAQHSQRCLCCTQAGKVAQRQAAVRTVTAQNVRCQSTRQSSGGSRSAHFREAMSPTARDVFPTPLEVPATTSTPCSTIACACQISVYLHMLLADPAAAPRAWACKKLRTVRACCQNSAQTGSPRGTGLSARYIS